MDEWPEGMEGRRGRRMLAAGREGAFLEEGVEKV